MPPADSVGVKKFCATEARGGVCALRVTGAANNASPRRGSTEAGKAGAQRRNVASVTESRLASRAGRASPAPTKANGAAKGQASDRTGVAAEGGGDGGAGLAGWSKDFVVVVHGKWFEVHGLARIFGQGEANFGDGFEIVEYGVAEGVQRVLRGFAFARGESFDESFADAVPHGGEGHLRFRKFVAPVGVERGGKNDLRARFQSGVGIAKKILEGCAGSFQKKQILDSRFEDEFFACGVDVSRALFIGAGDKCGVVAFVADGDAGPGTFADLQSDAGDLRIVS